MPFPYKTILLVGATAGIGSAMVDKIVEEGLEVIAVGRRQERLDELVRKHGSDKVTGVSFDISKRAEISQFVQDVTARFPDLDCVFLNAGLQQPHNFAKPDTVDLTKVHNEVSLNFTSFVDLTHAFLPFLLKKQIPTSIIYTTSHIAIVPFAPFPAYCASKAALNTFAMCLREQLHKTNVKVFDISPPIVQTELHGDRGRKIGIPASEFAQQTYAALLNGDTHIVIGSVGIGDTPAARMFPEVARKRDECFDLLVQATRGLLGD